MDDQNDTSYFGNDSATFGDRVVAAREVLGLSQEAFAKKLGVKLKTVRGWEDDISEPRANKLQMMAGMLNVSIMWLLTGEGDGVGEMDETGIPGDIAEILVDLRRSKADMQRLADRMGRLEKRLTAALMGE